MELAKKDGLVIACGGGTFSYPENAEIFKGKAIFIYLTASIGEVINRISLDNTRPLLNVPDPHKTALDLFNNRKPIYERYAEITIDTTKRTPEFIVTEILRLIT